MLISDWSSGVCSSDLVAVIVEPIGRDLERPAGFGAERHIGRGGRRRGFGRNLDRAGGEGEGKGECRGWSDHHVSPSRHERKREVLVAPCCLQAEGPLRRWFSTS